MYATFHFDLVTPEKRVLSQDEVMLTVPGAEGYFGVLPGHAPLVALLMGGVLTVGEGKGAVYYAISGGYAEVLPDRTTILADRVICWDAIDPAAAEREKAEAIESGAAVKEDESASRYWKKCENFANICLNVHKQYLARPTS